MAAKVLSLFYSQISIAFNVWTKGVESCQMQIDKTQKSSKNLQENWIQV